MPAVKPGESEKDYMSRCVPYVLNEGKTDDPKQAAAICHSLYAKHRSKATSEFDVATKVAENDALIDQLPKPPKVT